MSYTVYYNKNVKRNVKNIFWHDTEAREELILQDVCTAYKVATEYVYDTEAEAQAKADELNSEEAKHPFEKEGDELLCYFIA